MKIGTVMLLAALGFAAFYYTGLGVAGNDLLVIFKGFSIDSINTFTITVTLQNVSNATIQLNSLAATVTIDGDTLGNVSYFGNPISVGPNSQVDIPLKLNVSFLSLPGEIKDLMNNLGGNHTIEVKGNFNANNIPLPLDVSDVISV